MIPEGVNVQLGAMQDSVEGQEPDPAIKRRIEDLAAKGDLQTDEAQQELKSLVTDVVTGLRDENSTPNQRRRPAG